MFIAFIVIWGIGATITLVARLFFEAGKTKEISKRMNLVSFQVTLE